SKKGKFKINFGGEPTESKDAVDTDLGKIDITTYLYEASQSKVFMVAYSDYPSSSIEATDKKELLKGSKDGFVGNLQLNIDFEEFFTLDGNQGIYFKASNSEYHAAVKQILVDNRLYQIGILSSEGEISYNDVENFLNTFELID
ncbi:MAG: hypothetical protein ABIJ97_09835, partial [Bacteroidota bacterium]